jgi:antitoxin (DNA-binding transcriptional repressor) of toxin-antitoxin stability system
VCIACKGLRRCRINLEVLLDDVNKGAIIEIVDANEIAHLLFPLDSPRALSCYKDTGETALAIVQPLLSNALARVEELYHAGAYGSNFTRVGGLYHH